MGNRLPAFTLNLHCFHVSASLTLTTPPPTPLPLSSVLFKSIVFYKTVTEFLSSRLAIVEALPPHQTAEMRPNGFKVTAEVVVVVTFVHFVGKNLT